MASENNDLSSATVRRATPEDASAILAVYAPYVETTTISFETVVPSVAEFEARIRAIWEDFPYLVCVADEDAGASGEGASGRIVGFVYAHKAFERAAYAWRAETTVYVARGFERRGVGTALYRALLELLDAQGFRSEHGILVGGNDASAALHRATGFRSVGTLRRAGRKFGSWLDVEFYERVVERTDDSSDSDIPLPIPFVRLDPAFVDGVLKRASAAVRAGALAATLKRF